MSTNYKPGTMLNAVESVEIHGRKKCSPTIQEVPFTAEREQQIAIYHAQ